MLRISDVFIWEDLPRTDPDTGSLAMVAWIPKIQTVTTFIIGVVLIYHMIQNVITFTTNEGHPMIYETWYPFDTTKSPAYELANLAQVRVPAVKYCFTFFQYGQQNAVSTSPGRHAEWCISFGVIHLVVAYIETYHFEK
jgi:hypothetical protein